MPTLFVTATPIGNLSDFTPRAIETLKNVSLIAAEDTTHTIKLLNYFDIHTPMISYHKFNEKERAPELVSRMLKDGIDIAIVTDAGTPCISDPGYDLIALAKENGIKTVPVPGPCAAICALSVSGFETDTFSFIGFLERDNKEQKEQLKKLESSDMNNIVIYESPFRILKTLENISEIIDCDVCVCNDITKLHEMNITGNVKDVLSELSSSENAEKGEYVIVIHKNRKEIIENDAASPVNDISLEALLADIMVKNSCTAKDAIAILRKERTDLSKKEIYAASLNLRKLFSDDEEE